MEESETQYIQDSLILTEMKSFSIYLFCYPEVIRISKEVFRYLYIKMLQDCNETIQSISIPQWVSSIVFMLQFFLSTYYYML